MTQRKTRGRRDFSIRHGDKVYFPACAYTYWSEGDMTFSSKSAGGGRTPRKVKKWVRNRLFAGRYRPWWTNHATRGPGVPPGVLR